MQQPNAVGRGRLTWRSLRQLGRSPFANQQDPLQGPKPEFPAPEIWTESRCAQGEWGVKKNWCGHRTSTGARTRWGAASMQQTLDRVERDRARDRRGISFPVDAVRGA